MSVVYKRILLKLSGEAMSGEDNILDFTFVTRVAETVKKAVAEGVQVSIVIGGGNIWRGRSSGKMDRTRADHMGMIATAINSIAVQDTLIACGVDAKVLSAVKVEPFAEFYSKDLALKYYLHTGSGKDQLNIIFEALEHSEVPIATFRPTHVAGKIDQAIKFANMGGFIDITCDPDNMEKRCALIHRAMVECPKGSVTLSTDGNGSLPVWNEKKELIGIGAGKVISLHNTIKGLVNYEKLPLEEAITIATCNPAKALGLEGKKGCIAPGADADILLLDEELNIDTTIALGRVLLQGGEMQVFCNFEDC